MAFVDDLLLFTDRPVVSYPALEERPNRLLQDDNYGERLRTLKATAARRADRDRRDGDPGA